jgi:hypothetical protein
MNFDKMNQICKLQDHSPTKTKKENERGSCSAVTGHDRIHDEGPKPKTRTRKELVVQVFHRDRIDRRGLCMLLTKVHILRNSMNKGACCRVRPVWIAGESTIQDRVVCQSSETCVCWIFGPGWGNWCCLFHRCSLLQQPPSLLNPPRESDVSVLGTGLDWSTAGPCEVPGNLPCGTMWC